MNALLAVVHPSFGGGLLVVVGTILGAVGAIGLLFGWDDPGRTQADRDRDILKGRFG